jgi:DNA-binding Lrp family transcriptional regulator
MSQELDTIDRRILDLLQAQVPLTQRPFATLAGQVGISEQEMLARVAAMKTAPRKIIRQISAIFDSAALGYRSSLVAARVEPNRIDQAAAIISGHPGVSHNYKRENTFNLWYTIAVPPDSKLGLQRTVDILHQRSGALSTRLLPTIVRYKIGVKLDLSGDAGPALRADAPTNGETARSAGPTEEDETAPPGTEPTEAEKAIIRVAQQDLPIVENPFDLWAEQTGQSVDEFFSALRWLEQQGKMRRFAAVLRHREVGFTANGMGTWVVPAGRESQFGAIAAAFPEVSHCYLRPSYPDWPYNIFTMVHAESTTACEIILKRISQATGVTQYAVLYSTHEYKKVRVKYFTPENEQWEAAELRKSQSKSELKPAGHYLQI